MSKPNPANFTLEELQERFYVDEEGNVRNKISRKRAKRDGISGSISNGYRQIFFKGIYRRCHHIAWMLYYGEWPDAPLDHINGNGFDNRKENLRKVTMEENSRNRKMQINNTTGINGYTIMRINLPYRVGYYQDKKQRMKSFSSMQDAKMYLQKIRSEFGNGSIRVLREYPKKHIIHWWEDGKQIFKSFKTKEEALTFKEENDKRIQELYGYTERHGQPTTTKPTIITQH